MNTLNWMKGAAKRKKKQEISLPDTWRFMMVSFSFWELGQVVRSLTSSLLY